MNTRNIGLNRGKSRLWLEGRILLDAGFNTGDKYTLTNSNGTLIIAHDPANGKRKIAGTGTRPIIDINSAALLNQFITKKVSIELSGSMLIVRGI